MIILPSYKNKQVATIKHRFYFSHYIQNNLYQHILYHSDYYRYRFPPYLPENLPFSFDMSLQMEQKPFHQHYIKNAVFQKYIAYYRLFLQIRIRNEYTKGFVREIK